MLYRLSLNGHKKHVSLKRNDEKTDFQNNWLFFSEKKRVLKIPVKPPF